MNIKPEPKELRLFEFHSGELKYAISGENFKEAETYLMEDLGIERYESFREVPESEWDEKKIEMFEDNNHDNEPFYVSIREMIGEIPILIYTNDNDFIE